MARSKRGLPSELSCHDDLPESEAVGCAGCSTRYHAECLGEAGCVVLGCQQREPGRERAR